MAMLIAPLLMAALFGLVIVCVAVMEGSPFDVDVFTAWLAYSGYALGLGYFYVGCWIPRRLARKANWCGTQRWRYAVA
jgi:hypothetical protein